MIEARALTRSEESGAVLVSFDPIWYPLLRSGLTAVLRKRVPTTRAPNYIYFHLNSPIGRISARAKITSIETITPGNALKLAEELMLSEKEIRAYTANLDSIGVYRISNIEMAKYEISTSELRSVMNYNPPQSFLYLSHQARSIINEACHFGPPDVVNSAHSEH